MNSDGPVHSLRCLPGEYLQPHHDEVVEAGQPLVQAAPTRVMQGGGGHSRQVRLEEGEQLLDQGWELE